MLTISGFQKALEYWQLFLQGVVCTVSLSALTVVLGFILALVLATCRMGRSRILRAISTAYVELFRATPMVVQVFIIFYVVFDGVKVLPGFKLFGFIRFERFFPAVVALALNSGCLSVGDHPSLASSPSTAAQTEAARSLGLSSWKTMRFIVLPQAIKNILPAIANEFVTIIKESAICYTIGVQDIMSAVNAVKGATYRMGEALMIATALYFCLTFPTSKVIAHFERKMSRGDKR